MPEHTSEMLILSAHRDFTMKWSPRVGQKLSRLVYVLLAHANAKLEAQICQEEIASLCAISIRQVQRHLVELEDEWGLIQTVHSQTGNLYVFSELLAGIPVPFRPINDWKLIRVRILERDEFICGYCSGVANEVDHIIPRSQGGLTEECNLIGSCGGCNRHKAGRTPEQAGMQIGARR